MPAPVPPPVPVKSTTLIVVSRVWPAASAEPASVASRWSFRSIKLEHALGVIHERDAAQRAVAACFERARNVVQPAAAHPAENLARVVVALRQSQRQMQRVVGRQRRLPARRAGLAQLVAIGVERDGCIRRIWRCQNCRAAPSAPAAGTALECPRRRLPHTTSAAGERVHDSRPARQRRSFPRGPIVQQPAKPGSGVLATGVLRARPAA